MSAFPKGKFGVIVGGFGWLEGEPFLDLKIYGGIGSTRVDLTIHRKFGKWYYENEPLDEEESGFVDKMWKEQSGQLDYKLEEK